jgi:hypothetical protein
MDRFIERFLNDKKFGPAISSRPVPTEKIEKYKGKLPDKLLDYWQAYGWCGYAGGLLWTVDPDEWDNELEDWIGDTEFMEQDAYHVIARTAFGELILWGERTGQSLKVLTAWGMIFPSFDEEEFAADGPDLTLQLFFSSSSKDAYDTKDENGAPLFDRALGKLGVLDHDTMYGYVPALGLGGKAMLDNLQKLDAHVHLNIIAQATERQIMRDIAKDARDAGLM